MSNLGWEIKQINEDGACLFRSIADQVYGDQDFHHQVRQDCMNYIVSEVSYLENNIVTILTFRFKIAIFLNHT